MKQSSRQIFVSDAAAPSLAGRAVISGTIGGLAAAAAASLAGKREDGSYAAPLNATSHIIWGDEAARQDQPSLKYTLTGVLLNHASAIFWALFYEKLLGKGEKRRRWHHPKNWNQGARRYRKIAAPAEEAIIKPILGSAAVTAGAYLLDYHLIPKRFTPGFEKRLSGKSLAVVFVALAAGLAARDIMQAAKARCDQA
jgi:hypothetical protein